MAFRFCLTFLIAGGVLAVGCHAPHERAQALRGNSVKPKIVASQFPVSDEIQDRVLMLGGLENKFSSNNATENALIEAHAHYAAGIVHEMNIEVEPALSEYYN